MHHSTYDARSGARLSTHTTSSAFSPNANPNEDWTKISDLAERRRIQNRIAQRNYRKKLKRRLEDLERRAASSASPEQPPTRPLPPKMTPSKMRSKQRERVPKSTDTKPHTTHASPPERPVSYDNYTPSDERAMFAQQCTRQLSASPPPVFSYPSLPAYDAYHSTSYTQLPLYHTMPSTEISFPYSESMPPVVPPALNIPRKPAYDEDIISPFSMSYASMAGIDLCPQSQQQHPPSLPVQMPSLSYDYADDHRAPSTSPETSLFTFPLTPESPPCSPRSMPGLYEYDLRP